MALGVAALVTVASCGGDDPPTGPGDPTLSIALSPTSGTVVQGGSLTVTGSATFGGAFSGGVTFVVSGLPTGVTFTVGTPTTSGNTISADITVIVAASVAPGTYPGTISASGSGVSDATAYSLTVTAASTGGLSLGSVSSASVERGGSTTRAVDITRTGGFTGDVTIAVEGVPPGVTATPAPVTTGGASSTITIDVGGGAATGTTTLTVRGTASGLPDATTTFDLTVTAPAPTTDIAFDYSACDVLEQPAWFAFQDGAGTGTWTRVTGTAQVYGLSVSESTFGVATVVDAPSGTQLGIIYYGVAQIGGGTVDACPPPLTKTVGGTAAGTVGLTRMSLGGAGSSALLFSDGAFLLSAVPDGALDLVGYSANGGAGSDRMLIERDLDIASGGSLGTVDFGVDGFDPDSVEITLTGLAGGESGLAGMDYASSSAGAVCAVSPLYANVLTGATYAGMSATATEQASDEYHVVSVTAATTTGAKVLRESFSALADREVAMPADLPDPTVTDVTGGAGYLRLQADYVLPGEYDRQTFFSYAFDTWNVAILATGAAFSGSASLDLPDFSSVGGWDGAWAIPTIATGVEYGIGATGLTSQDALCTDGGRSVTSSLVGTYN